MSSSFVLEHNDRLFFASRAHVVNAKEDVGVELASAIPSWDMGESNPYIMWINGAYVQSGSPNENSQYWTYNDLEISEYSIRFAPLNINHNVRRPVGFFAATKTIDLDSSGQDDDRRLTIDALSGLWSHVFPFEADLARGADDMGSLHYSMECVAKVVRCGGPLGCGQEFDYSSKDDYCAHLKERVSYRHLVEPTFRGGALIIPPVKPGWSESYASVISDCARKYAEETASSYNSLKAEGADLSPGAWESLMASIVSMAEA